MKYSLVALMLLAAPLIGADRYVRKDGNDANDGLTNTSGGAKLTVQAAVNVATTPGDTIYVGRGVYDEVVDTTTSGTSGNYITIDGQGVATIKRIDVNHDYIKLMDLTVSGQTTAFTWLVYIAQGADNGWITGCTLDAALAQDITGLYWQSPGSAPYGSGATAGGSNWLIENSVITRIASATAVSMYGADNVFQNNTVKDIALADFVRLWGERNIIQDNLFKNNYYLPLGGYHPDFIQVFGDAGFGSEDHVIQRNVVDGVEEGQLTQFEAAQKTGGDTIGLVTEIRNWTFINNVFKNIDYQASCTIPGIKYYNNVFYRCNNGNGGAALVFGSRSYDADEFISYAHNTEVKGNIFIDCGDTTPGDLNDGWYSISTELTGVSADYNFVAKRFGTQTWYSMDVDGTERSVGDVGGWSTFDWWEDNGINGGDPMLRDIEGGDFMPIEGSPLKNAGVAIAGFSDDYDGTSRPVGAAWDIGPFEATADVGGSTIYVATTGNDTTGTGLVGAPYRTIQKGVTMATAGDTVSVAAGAYAEYVTSAASGTRAAPIVVKGVGTVSTRGFRYNGHDYITLENLTFTGAQNTWGAHVRVDATSDHGIVRYCHFGPGVYVISDDFTFDESDDSVSSSSVDFEAAGFIAGGGVYYGGTPLEGYVYDNHNRANTIATVTANKMTFSTPIFTETNPSAWAPIYAAIPGTGTNSGGASKTGISGIGMIVSSSSGPDYFTITRNTFDDIFGAPVELFGTGHTFTHNTITATNSWWGIRLSGYPGDSYRIEHNFWYDSPNTVINYTVSELGSIPHPGGAEWFDHAVGFIALQNAGANIEFNNNWLQNIHQPLGQWSEVTYTGSLDFADANPDTITRASGSWITDYFSPGAEIIVRGSDNNDGKYTIASLTATVLTLDAADELTADTGDTNAFVAATHDIWVRGNVFVGVAGSLSAGWDGMQFVRNTFYRCGYDDPYTQALTIGGNDPDYADNIRVEYNAFIDIGSRANESLEGAYSVVFATDTALDNNFIVGPETKGWNAQTNFSETNGTNGGDPLLRNPADPLGTDGLPFTEDDGLAPYVTSPMFHSTTAVKSSGALARFLQSDTSNPYGTFKVSSISTGYDWYDATGSLFDTAWIAQLPWERQGRERPYTTPEALGSAGVQVTFDASASFDGGTITNYAWTTSDGGSQSGASATFTRTFSSPGTITVTLVVTDNSAETDTVSKQYRVLGESVAQVRRSPSRAARTGALPFLP